MDTSLTILALLVELARRSGHTDLYQDFLSCYDLEKRERGENGESVREERPRA